MVATGWVRRRAIGLLVAMAFAYSAPAMAQDRMGIDACGDINVSAEAQCKVIAEGGCVAECKPINFEAACEAECTGQCTASAEVSCTGGCEADCVAQCEIEPGTFDCRAACTGQCDADCAGACEANANSAECQGACEARCEGECDAECDVTPPEASCEAKCQASCNASCNAAANADCQVDCSGSCKAELTGGCEAQCRSPEGALFCDGQYVDAGNNLEECVAALEAALNIEVQGYAEGEASCEGNACVAEGEAGCSCATVRSSPSGATAPVAFALFGLGLVFARRRNRGASPPR